MWIGILVLITFGICAVACLFLSIRAAMQDKWHVFGALLLPAFGIGGTIVMLVARPITLELFGDSNLEDRPADVVAVVGEDLAAMHSDTVRFGLRYDDDTQLFHWYDESHDADGGFSGRNDIAQTWSGGWDVVGDEVCFSQGQNTTCYGVFQDGDLFYEVNHRDEIVNRFMMMVASEAPKERQPLSAAVVSAILPGRTLTGELQLHFGEPAYSAAFAADGDTVSVSRGDTETGTYRIDDDGGLCLAGVFHITDACLAVVPRPGGFDLVRDDRRIVATVTSLR